MSTNEPLCAIDTETTGLDMYSYPLSIAILPLNSNYDYSQNDFFYSLIKPYDMKSFLIQYEYDKKVKEAMEINKLKIEDLENSPTMNEVKWMINGWFKGKNISKIRPLAFNWAFDHRMVLSIFDGIQEEMDKKFSRIIIDVPSVARNLLELCVYSEKKCPFEYSHTNLKNMCEIFNITNENAHNALDDAMATAKVYKKLVKLQLKLFDCSTVVPE